MASKDQDQKSFSSLGSEKCVGFASFVGTLLLITRPPPKLLATYCLVVKIFATRPLGCVLKSHFLTMVTDLMDLMS